MVDPWIKSAIIAGLCVSAVATPTEAQRIVTGLVREDSSGRPLAGVDVSIEGSKQQTRTDSAGRYRFEAPEGIRIALFRILGYQQLRVRVNVKGDSVVADATLLRTAATELEAVRVDAPKPVAGVGREGFAERRALGFGKFIDSTALRARDNRRLPDVLRELTGVRLEEYRDLNTSVVELRAISPTKGTTQDFAYKTPAGIMQVPGRPSCWVSVFFNGASMYRSERGAGGKPPDFNRDFSVSSIEAIEYYRSASDTPQQFGGANANCGALVLWSRR